MLGLSDCQRPKGIVRKQLTQSYASCVQPSSKYACSLRGYILVYCRLACWHVIACSSLFV